MKSILIIGLGRFGRHIAMKLDELHHHVMAVDKEDTRVDAVLPFVTNAQIGDATNEDFLGSLGVGNFDVCIVAIGDNFQNSLEVTSLLKELGAKWWCLVPLVMFMQNFFYETAQMKLFIPKGSLPIGLRSVIVLIIFSIT